jgi:alkylated DNA repair dioxygenase AlkB
MNLLPSDGEAYLFANFFSPDESRDFFDKIREETAWKHESIVLFGKPVMQPRLTAWYGDSGKAYRYSGIKMDPLEWTATLIAIKTRVESVSNTHFTSVLLNFYRDGRDSMGWHRDNEPELGPDPVIASVSFGATRSFHFRHRAEKTLKRKIELEDGSLLLMKGTTQTYWDHSIGKTARLINPRINLTFRCLV